MTAQLFTWYFCFQNTCIWNTVNNQYSSLGREGPYFVKEHSDSKSKYTEEGIIRMLEFLVDIFVDLAGKVFQQIIGIPVGTNGVPLPTNIFLYSYESEFVQSLLLIGRIR